MSTGSHTTTRRSYGSWRATGRAGSQRPRSWARSSPAVSCCPSSRVLPHWPPRSLRQWRAAAFLPFALGVESGSYRATTLVVHRHRPAVHRLEQLDVRASYPRDTRQHRSRSTAGSPCSPPLVSPSRRARIAVWTVALLIPVYVAFARMYRGMHHPLDVAGGVLIGVAALGAIVLVSRASGSAAQVQR